MATTTQITYAYNSDNSYYLTPIAFNGVALGVANGGDKYVSPTIMATSEFEVGSTYYLKFTTRSMRASDYIVDVLLTSSQSELSAKLLKSITIPGLGSKGNTNELTTYMNEFLFSPSDKGYNGICLSLRQSQVEQFKSPAKDLNNLIFQNAVTDYIQIEGDQNLIQGKMRIGKTDDMDVESKLLFKDGDNVQEVLVKQNNEEKKLILQYGEEEIVIDLSFNASSQVALIDDSAEIDPTQTNWTLQDITEEDQYIGDWLPVYYFTSSNLKKDWALKNIKLAKVKNIINPPEATDIKEISKVGLQARPNTMFMIDGQEFRMGASGLYQIEYPDLKISSIGIVPPADEKIYTANDREIALNFFILDYRYNKKDS